MIRLVVLSAVVLIVGVHAWKDWYKSLCGLIVLMAFLSHPDMPRTMFGIQGLNLWNALFLVILVAWLTQRGRERLVGHLPSTFLFLLLTFLAVIVTAFIRLMIDRQALAADVTTAGLISEYLVNPVKWIVPGLLLFDGCRTRSRFLWALVAILTLYVLLSVQVIRWMPIEAVFNRDTLERRSLRILLAETGYYRVDLSVILAGASWALFAAGTLARSTSRRTLVLITAAVVLFAQALTGGRGGYLAWVVIGLTLGLLRWRRWLLLAPALAIVLSALPGVADRASEGLSEGGNASSSGDLDMEKLTAGRSTFWPLVIEKIVEEPILGHGRAAMNRTGLAAAISEDPAEQGPDNPHSAYLEILLDTGLVGFALTLALFGYVVVNALSLIRDGRSPVCIAIGGVTSALVIAQLVGSLTGQSFYPREGTLGMWCAIGLMLRISFERTRTNQNFPLGIPSHAQITSTGPSEWWRPTESHHSDHTLRYACRPTAETSL